MSAFQPCPTNSAGQHAEYAALCAAVDSARDLLSPRAALRLAHAILADLAVEGCSYADFQSAQSAQKAVRTAVRALDYHV